MGIINKIKEEAKGNRTKIQSTDAHKLECILNNLFFLPKDINEETKFINLVMTRGLESQERVGLHASALIAGEKDFCIRAQVLSLLYKQLQGEQISVGLKRIFEEGNAIHEKWQRLFIRGGFSKSNDLDRTRVNKKYMLSYTPDIECTIPEFYDGKMIGEIKSVNTFQFQRMVSHPSAKKQLQWYMYLTGVHKGFVLNDDKNTQDFKIEVYDYDASLVAPYVERAEEIVYIYNRLLNEGRMVARPKDAKSLTCKKCTNCNMKDACWNVGIGRVRI